MLIRPPAVQQFRLANALWTKWSEMEYHHLLLQSNCIWRLRIETRGTSSFLHSSGGRRARRNTPRNGFRADQRRARARSGGPRGIERIRRLAKTDSEGIFEVDVPSAGAYRVSVEQPGFRPYLQPDVQVAGPSEINVELEIAAVREVITVEDRLEEVRAQAPEISQVVSGTQLRELPSNGRNLARFALLDPHVRNTNGLGADGSSGSRLSINASSFRHTAYALDGATNYDSIFANAPQQTIGVGAVAEFKVLTNQYSAEYGTTTSGIVVAATKSGANDVHGEAFWFARPSGIQAAPPVSPFRVPNERQQWGGSLGGPVRRDRTFASETMSGSSRSAGLTSSRPRRACTPAVSMSGMRSLGSTSAGMKRTPVPCA